MTRLTLTALLCLGLAAPAAAQIVPAPPPIRVSPDGKVQVQLVFGPHAGLGRRGERGCAVQWLLIHPGGRVAEHVHEDSDELVAIVNGSGTITIEGEATRVKSGASIFIPRGKRHSFVGDHGATTVASQVYDPAGPEARFLTWSLRPNPEGAPSPTTEAAPASPTPKPKASHYNRTKPGNRSNR